MEKKTLGCWVVFILVLILIGMKWHTTKTLKKICDLRYTKARNMFLTHPNYNLMVGQVSDFYSELGKKPGWVECDSQGEVVASLQNIKTNKLDGAICDYSCTARFDDQKSKGVYLYSIQQSITLRTANDKQEMDDWREFKKKENDRRKNHN